MQHVPYKYSACEQAIYFYAVYRPEQWQNSQSGVSIDQKMQLTGQNLRRKWLCPVSGLIPILWLKDDRHELLSHSKERFPLERILHTERNFSLFVSSQAQKANKKFRSVRKILASAKQAQSTILKTCADNSVE